MPDSTRNDFYELVENPFWLLSQVHFGAWGGVGLCPYKCPNGQKGPKAAASIEVGFNMPLCVCVTPAEHSLPPQGSQLVQIPDLLLSPVTPRLLLLLTPLSPLAGLCSIKLLHYPKSIRSRVLALLSLTKTMTAPATTRRRSPRRRRCGFLAPRRRATGGGASRTQRFRAT